MNKKMPIKCYTCQQNITFDKNILSKTGKQIPLTVDKKFKHGHDASGNPVNQPIEEQDIQSQQQQEQQEQRTQQQLVQKYSKQELGSTFTPTDIPRTSQGGLPLDTKRLLQAVVELTKEFREFRDEVRNSIVMIDSGRYENQMKVMYECISPLLNTQKTAADILNENNPSSSSSVLANHAKKADDYINFMQEKKKIVENRNNNNKIKFVDESKEEESKNLDEMIPESKDFEYLKEHDENEEVIDEE